MCMWISEAPAPWHATAASTSSASVVGSWGQSLLAVSAPVGATVIRVPLAEAVTDVIRVEWLLIPDIVPAARWGQSPGCQAAAGGGAAVWCGSIVYPPSEPCICGRENRDVLWS